MSCLYLTWLPEPTQSETLAQALGIELVDVSASQSGASGPRATLRQVTETRRVLNDRRPDLVFAALPPAGAAAAVARWCRRNDAALVIDAQPESLTMSLGANVRRALRQATITLVSSSKDFQTIDAVADNAMLLAEPPLLFEIPDSALAIKPGSGPDDILLINSYGNNEPVETLFEAADFLPDVKFGVTGKHKDAPRGLRKKAPANVALTGWMGKEAFWDRLAGARALMTLTTREESALGAGWEARALGQPLITSDWPALRDQYPQGAIHIENTPQGISIGVEWVLMHGDRLRQEMQELGAERLADWERQSAPLRELIEQLNQK